MKTAYCFSGHLRTFKQNHSLGAYLMGIKKQHGDIFIHTYAVKNVHGPMWHGDRAGWDEGVTNDDLNWVKQFYSNYGDVQALYMDPAVGGSVYMPPGCEAMGYRHSIAMANELRKNFECMFGFEYDLVFNARFDLVLGEPLLLPHPRPNVFYGGYNLTAIEKNVDGEVFSYASSHVMDKMVHPMIPQSELERVPGYELCGEKLFTSIRQRHGFEYQAHKIKYGLLRSTGLMEVRT